MLEEGYCPSGPLAPGVATRAQVLPCEPDPLNTDKASTGRVWAHIACIASNISRGLRFNEAQQPIRPRAVSQQVQSSIDPAMAATPTSPAKRQHVAASSQTYFNRDPLAISQEQIHS